MQASLAMQRGIPLGKPPVIELRNQHAQYAATWYVSLLVLLSISQSLLLSTVTKPNHLYTPRASLLTQLSGSHCLPRLLSCSSCCSRGDEAVPKPDSSDETARTSQILLQRSCFLHAHIISSACISPIQAFSACITDNMPPC